MNANAGKPNNDRENLAGAKPSDAANPMAVAEELPLDLQLLEFWDKNKTLIIAVACLVIIGVTGYLGVKSWTEGQREERGSALTSAKDAAALQAVADKYPGEEVGSYALMLLADKQYQENKFAEAEKSYQKFIDQYPKSPLLGSALYGKGAARESLGDYDGAIKNYQRVLGEASNDIHASDARLAIARCEEGNKHWQKARQLYEELKVSAPNSPWAEQAQARIVVLDREAHARGETLLPTALPAAMGMPSGPAGLLPTTPAAPSASTLAPVPAAPKPVAPAPAK